MAVKRASLIFSAFGLSACVAGSTSPSDPLLSGRALFSCPDDIALQGVGGGLCVNEVQSNNRSSFSVRGGAFPPWVELANQSDATINLGDVSLSTRDSGPQGLSGQLRPSKFVVVTLGDAGLVPLSLDRDGDVVSVHVDGLEVNGFLAPTLGPDQAWARFPDAGAAAVTGVPTSNATNGVHSGTSDPSDRLYQCGSITQFKITLSGEACDSLNQTVRFEKRKVPGDLSFAEGTLVDFGVRIDGGLGGFRKDIDRQKVSFKTGINAYRPHRIRGVKPLIINGYLEDPSVTHEHLTYLLYRSLGLPAPRTLYMAVEAAVWHLDGYFDSNNYRVYYDPRRPHSDPRRARILADARARIIELPNMLRDVAVGRA